MMKKLIVFLSPLLLAACIGQPTRTSEVAATQAPAVTARHAATTPPAKKTTPLSSELLYHLMVAEIAGQRGQLAIAVQQYYQAALLSRDPDVVERAARIAIYARDDVIALKIGKLWLQLEPDSVQAYTVIATAQIKQAQYDAALQTLDHLLTLTEQHGQRGYHFIFSLLGRQRDKQAALDLLDKLMKKHGQTADALFAYGRLALLVGELDKATTAVKHLLVLKPEWEDAQQLWVNLLIRQGKDTEALDFLAKTVAKYPQNQAMRMYYARKLVDEKRLADAFEQFKILLEQDNTNMDARYALGLLSLEMNHLDDAEGYFKALYADQERSGEAAFYLGQIAEQRHKDKDAIHWYSLVSDGQHYVGAQIRIAMTLAQAGDLEAARKRLHNIEATSPSIELRLYLAEGELLRTANRSQEAFDLYSKALLKMPGNSQLLYARALTAEKLEHLDVAVQDLKTIVKQEPNNVQALNALGYTLADRTKHYKEALKYIEAAYKLNSTDPAIIDSLGWVYYRMGNHDKAWYYLQHAFALLKDPEIGAHLGEVLWVTGKQQQARQVWKEALQTQPQHKTLRDVIKRFTQ